MNSEVLPSRDVGYKVLLSISEADGLNQWMFEQIAPYLKGTILEVGSGIGNISAVLAKNERNLFLSDNDDHYCRLLKEKFAGQPQIKGVYHLDIADKGLEEHHPTLIGAFDTVFALNVIEHIQDDSAALMNISKLLAPGGHVIVLMPAYQWLFNKWDRQLGHYRRHTERSLQQLLSKDFDVTRTWHFNVAGIFGWWWVGSVLRRPLLSQQHMRMYERLLPVFKGLDKLFGHRVGLSVIGVGKKRN